MSVFHLSLPVIDFEETKLFYCEVLGGKLEKITPEWFNVNLDRHQLTFHLLPEQIIISKHIHWGLVVKWDTFHRLFDKLKEQNVSFSQLPDYQGIGLNQERVKMIFIDPSGYLIEFKSYKCEALQF